MNIGWIAHSIYTKGMHFNIGLFNKQLWKPPSVINENYEPNL